MTDRPIIFSAPMIHALLAGRKTQMRRILKPQPDSECVPPPGWSSVRFAVGDRLWVRERGWISKSKLAFLPYVGNETQPPQQPVPVSPNGEPYKNCPSIHMPRWASRLTLIVTDVKVERLQDISEEAAKAEGVFYSPAGFHFVRVQNGGIVSGATAKECFSNLWNDINGPDAWEANPWVVAVSFTVHNCNIDQMREAA